MTRNAFVFCIGYNGGTAIVIHAVSGGTGSAAPARIACGIITKP